MYDRKLFLIGVLSISAVVLGLGHLQLSQTATANVEVAADDYQLVTGRTQRGDDGLYVFNRRNNLVIFFTWDPAKRTVIPRDVRSLDGMLNGQ
jgi:hypothetical protein